MRSIHSISKGVLKCKQRGIGWSAWQLTCISLKWRSSFACCMKPQILWLLTRFLSLLIECAPSNSRFYFQKMHSGIFEVNCSKDIKIQGIIGPCASLEKVSPKLFKDPSFLFALFWCLLVGTLCRKVLCALKRLLVRGVLQLGRCVALTNLHLYVWYLRLWRRRTQMLLLNQQTTNFTSSS